jgi:diguanylate cyclase (GGDEF)-like protein
MACKGGRPQHSGYEQNDAKNAIDTPHASSPHCRQHHSNEVSAGRAEDLNIDGVRGATLGSFKVKLVAYFLLLSLLPIGAAFWGFTQVAGQSETRRVDARLQAGMRAVLASYQEQVNAAQHEATGIAKAKAFQQELETGDLAALVHTLSDTSPNVSVSSADGIIFRRPVVFAATRQATVFSRRGLVGFVTVSVPFDATLVAELRRSSGLAPADSLVILHRNSIVASSPAVAGAVVAPVSQMKTIAVGRDRFRTLVAPAVPDDPAVRFAVLSPQSLIDAANSSSRNRLLLGLIASLALVSLVAYFEGRSIVRTLRGLAEAAHGIARGRLTERVPVRGRDEFAMLGTAFNDMANQLEARLAELEAERGRLRDAITRFGEALAATHDVHQQLLVIVEAAVEATGANGGRLLADDGTLLETGEPDSPGERLEFQLTAGRTVFGTLTIVGDSFDEEQRLAASSLASHAAIALENARLHRIVERQALVDGLTGIANRRQCEDALTAEMARSERLGSTLTLVLADLDDFKAVNDVHGHAVGDDVLRRFAAVLRSTVRDSDLAGRWGGEEFLLLLPGADAVGGAQLADRVRAAFSNEGFEGPNGESVRVTCSFGVAQFRPGDDQRELFAAADRALYRAKRAGKNRVELEAPVRSF